MTENDDSGGFTSRAEEFLQVFKKGAEFTQGLLKENERLRYRVLELEQQHLREDTSTELSQVKEKLTKSETEKQNILDRIASIEKENLDFVNRYADIETDNNLLANLYITTYQLHSTFDAVEIVRVIEEILLNLVGAEQFSLFLRDEDGQLVQPLIGEAGESRLVEVELSDLRVKEVLASGEGWVASADELSRLGETDAKAVIPLQVENKLVGVLAIYRLLAQKKCFTDIDEEIFSLLGGHAAMAICTAVLHRENTGQINFRQGFLA